MAVSLIEGSGKLAVGVTEDAPCDHQALNLAGSFVDLRDLGVAEVALHRELLRVAVAAEDLDRLGRLAARLLGREELRLGALLLVRLTLLLQPRRPVREQPRGVDLGRHVRELELDRLELGDPPSELTP